MTRGSSPAKSSSTTWKNFPVPPEGPSSPAPGLASVPLWDGCPDGRLAVLDPVALTLHLFGPGEGEAETIQLPWQPASLRRIDKFSYIRFQVAAEARGDGADAAAIDGAAESTFAGAEDFFPAEAPAGVDLKCAPGRVWIQEFAVIRTHWDPVPTGAWSRWGARSPGSRGSPSRRGFCPSGSRSRGRWAS